MLNANSNTIIIMIVANFFSATGEPATCMSVVVTFALREAISMARRDAGIPTTQWFQIGI